MSEELDKFAKKVKESAGRATNEVKEHLPHYSKTEVREMLDDLYESIKHGDNEHQTWLKFKIEEFKKKV